jgi:competence protein ComEA
MNIRRWLIETFGFGKNEMRGMWILLFLIVTIAIVPRIYFGFKQNNGINNQTPEEKLALQQWAEEMNQAIKIKKEEKSSKWNNSEKIQFAEKNENWSSYKKSGFEKTPKPREDFSLKKEKIKITKININSATPIELEVIKGIGPTLSERIVKYKNMLGGFHSASQLSEVYGLSPEVILALEESLTFTDSLKKISINTDSIKFLSAHPYIDYRTAKQIVNYRQTHGDYSDPADLLKLKTMTDSLYQKLYPYISTRSSE